MKSEENTEAYIEKSVDFGKNPQGIFLNKQIIPFGMRLKSVIGDMPIREFSRKFGLSDKTLRDYMQGKSYPTLDRLGFIALASGKTVEWLATGKEELDYAYDPNSQLDINELESAIKTVKEFAERKGTNPSDTAFAKAVAIVYTLDAHDEPLSKELIRKVASFVI